MRTQVLVLTLLAWATPAARAEPVAALPEDDEPIAPDESAQPCMAEPVSLQRLGVAAPVVVSLTDCAGHPNLEALPALSLLAQPPSAASASGGPDAQARALNPELLVRLQRIASEFPGHAIEVVSGYRPNARPGSRHHSGDALDLRVEGVDNTAIVTLLRSLAATGVGYYPNSTFVHVDVRNVAFYWVDRSAPGEAPSYVAEPELPAAATPAAASAVGTTPTQAAVTLAPETDTDTAVPSEPGVEAEAAQATNEVQSATAVQLDAELQSLAERALVVMNLALGRTAGSSSALPDRAEL